MAVTNRTNHSDDRGSPTWPAYAAAAWAIVFTVIPLPWVLGLDAGRTWADEQLGVGSDIPVIALVGATLLKIVGAAVALATVRRWGRRVPRGLVLAGNWAAAGLLIGYALLTVVVNAVIRLELIEAPASRRDLVAGQLAVYAPWFVVGGVLFALTALAFGRRTRGAGAPFDVTPPR